MRLRRFQALQLVLLISVMVATRAAGQNSTTTKQVRINLTEPDGLVTRFMIVNGASGEPLPGFRTIQSFDASTNTLTFIDVQGRMVHLPLSRISAVDFRQEMVRQSMMAQEPAWDITAQYGTVQTLQIPPSVFHIADGMILVDVHATSELAGPNLVVEARRLTFDSRDNLILLTIQPVSYKKNMLGSGGGASGLTKGLQ
jgi:hypothetical protein